MSPRALLGGALSALLAAVTLVGMPALTATPAQASTQQIFDGPNGAVNALAVAADGTAYLGGTFTAWGPQTGGGAVMDPVTAAVDRTFPPVTGTISAVVDDGAGGWYIGGSFTHVAGVARSRLAHILPSGALDESWVPQANDDVARLVRSGSVIYAGGVFTGMCGAGSSCGSSVTRQYLAAINSDGTINPWNPNANSDILGMAVSSDGATIYVGGNFTSMCGAGSSCDQTPQSRSYLAAIGTDGALGPWSATPGAGRGGTWVRSLAVSGSRIYVGGNFTTVNGSARGGLAALSTAGVLDSSWAPSVTGGYPDVQAVVVSPDDSTVYVAGDFTTINSSTRPYLGAVNASDGATTSWYPNPSGKIWGLAVSGSTVYAAGEFSTVCGAGSSCEQSAQTRNRFAAFGTDGSLKSWDPNVNNSGFPNTVAVSGSVMYVGGNFTTIGVTPRNRLAAVGPNGTLTSWNPDANNTVSALAVSGSTVYAGGSFTAIGGVTRNRLAAIGSDGTLGDWNPDAGGTVSALTIADDTVYAGGSFTTIGGQTRNRVAAIGTSGTLASWNPSSGGTVNALAVSGSTVYAGGSFTSFGGQTRNRLAAVGTSGTLLPWNPNANTGSVNTLAVSGSNVYAGGSFTAFGGGATTRNRIAAINSGGSPTSFNANAGSTVNAVSVSGSTVYAGGAFASIGGASRSRVAAMTSGGTATSWDPSANNTVNALTVSGGTVYVGGSFTSLAVNARGAAYVANFALVPTGVPGTPGTPTAVAGDTQATVTISAPGSGGAPTSYTITSAPGGFTCTVTGASGSCTVTGLTNGQAYTFTSTATNTLGTSSASSASAAVTPRALPTAPTALVATPGNGSAEITFTPGSDGGSAITNYAYTLDDSTWTSFSPDDTTSPVTITGLTNGTAYSIKLRAISSAGNGAASAAVTVTPADPSPPPPPRPPPPAMTPDSQSLTGVVGTPVTPTSMFVLTHFALTPRFSVFPLLPGGLSLDPLTGVVTGTPTLAYPSTRHWISAIAGQGSEWASSTLQVEVTPTTPSTPRALIGRAGDRTIAFTWEAPELDGGSPITEYDVRVSPQQDGCQVGAGSRSCTVAGLTNGTEYRGEVRARNAAGWGPWSPASGAVTPAAPSIAIVGTRLPGSGGRIVSIAGESKGLGDDRVQPWFKMSGRPGFTAAVTTATVSPDGSFVWTRRTSQAMEIYVVARGVRSNTVSIGAR